MASNGFGPPAVTGGPWRARSRPVRGPCVGRWVDSRGETVGAPMACTAEEARLDDEALCQLGCGQITAAIAEREGDLFIANLHRGARHVLGEHPEDLRHVSAAERETRYRRALLPALSGRVKGVPEHPEFYDHCVLVLDQMIGLGHDTRDFRGEEPAAFLAEEAARIRKAAPSGA